MEKKYFEIYKLLFNLTTNKLKEYQAGKQASYCNCVFEIVFLLYLKLKKYVVKGKYRQIRKDMLFIYKDLSKLKISLLYSSFYYLCTVQWNPPYHGLRTPNEGINQRYLKNWADVADKICCRHT